MLVQSVGAAWLMTQLSGSSTMVALVQTALMLPIMLWSIPAGAAADMYDRRHIALIGLFLSLLSATLQWVMATCNLVTPASLLTFCFFIGSGMALYNPAWQSSVTEQVPAQSLPHAITLNSISFNVARSFGPAIGGVIVAFFGPRAAFFTTALLYPPMIIVLLSWRRTRHPPRLPPERMGRAIVSGVRYIAHSPSIRVVLLRCFVMGFLGGSLTALMPLIARTLLGGGPLVYGVMLGSFGVGAIGGALLVPYVRKRFHKERAIGGCAIILGISMIMAGTSRWLALTIPFLFLAGAMWMVSVALFNISVQTSSPRWVAGRVLAAFQASVTGGVALGSWLWGGVAHTQGVSGALLISAVLMLMSSLLGLRFRLPDTSAAVVDATVSPVDPELSLALSPLSGPIIIEVEYSISTEHAREFYQLMEKMQLVRKRNGAYGWSIARDVANAELWIERFRCPTWMEYLRLRGRSTQAELDLQRLAREYHQGGAPPRVRRMLERPFGSVRWKENSVDAGETDVLPVA
jgi:MFS family permease